MLHNNCVKYGLLVFLSFIEGYTSSLCKFNVKIKQSLRNEGFHRNLTYGIVFNADNNKERWLYKNCIVGLDQTLPPGVYVNPDELSDLRRVQKVNAIPKNRVNIELPADQSYSSSVYVMGKVANDKVYLWLPVHARYHQAVAGGGVARNEIEAPKLYLRCPDQRLAVCDKAITPSVSFLCNGSSKEKCSWKDIPYTMVSGTVVWHVPVGNTQHYNLVASGTALVLLAGTLYLFNAIHEYKIGDRRKKL